MELGTVPQQQPLLEAVVAENGPVVTLVLPGLGHPRGVSLGFPAALR